MAQIDETSARMIAEIIGQRISVILSPVQALTTTAERIVDHLDEISRRLNEIDKRVVHLEAAPLRPEIERQIRNVDDIRKEIALLQAWKHQVEGAMNLFSWVKSSWPLLVSVGGAITAYKLWGDPR